MGSARPLEIAVRHKGLRVDRKAIAAAVGVLDEHAEDFNGGCPAGELSIAFMADRELAELHGRFLDDPSPTDVITFASAEPGAVAGEICVSVDAAARQVGRSPLKLSGEILLYVVHGWLHLAGYDDLRPAAKRIMRRAEARALGILRKAGVIPRFKLA
jgi:probable rRNA maturation factor